jgi:hypothetical protein
LAALREKTMHDKYSRKDAMTQRLESKSQIVEEFNNEE